MFQGCPDAQAQANCALSAELAIGQDKFKESERGKDFLRFKS